MEEYNNITKISFVKRPISIPPDYRPMFKVVQIVMILGYCCRSNRSSLLKLHLFSWALKTEGNIKKIIDWVDTNFQSDFAVWGIEPTLNRGLQYAISEKVCRRINNKFELTEKGVQLFNSIKRDKELLKTEKIFFNIIGKKISDDKINNLVKKWTLFYVKD
jgi:hypothetical protein